MYVFSGSAGALLQQMTGAPGSEFGYSVASIGSDINEDGRGDLLIGIPKADAHDFTNVGTVLLLASPSFTGFVFDNIGTAVPSATVEARRNWPVGSDSTNSSGRYSVGNLIPSEVYDLVASKTGFISKVRQDIVMGRTSRRMDFVFGQITTAGLNNGDVVIGLTALRARASDPSGIQAVELLVDGEVIGRDTDPPYEAAWQTFVDCEYEGEHTVTAQAFARDGQSGASEPITVVVDNTTFEDVPCDHFAWRFIEAVVRAGIASGFKDGTFRPGLEVNRGQMAVFMARAADTVLGDFESFDPPRCGRETFADVPCDYYAYKFIEYLAAKGLAAGSGHGNNRRFNPEGLVSRAAMAVFLARVRDLLDGDLKTFDPPGCGDETFPDVDCEQWAYPFIEYIGSKDITAGHRDGTYRPEVIVSRAHMAVFVTRAAELEF